MQPVYVGDVATAVADAVNGKTKEGRMCGLGGPEVLTMREIMEIILSVIERKRMLLSLPFGLAKLQALVAAVRAGAVETDAGSGRAAALRQCGVGCGEGCGADAGRRGITPDSLEAIAPQYLWRFRKAGQFQKKSARSLYVVPEGGTRCSALPFARFQRSFATINGRGYGTPPSRGDSK